MNRILFLLLLLAWGLKPVTAAAQLSVGHSFVLPGQPIKVAYSVPANNAPGMAMFTLTNQSEQELSAGQPISFTLPAQAGLSYQIESVRGAEVSVDPVSNKMIIEPLVANQRITFTCKLLADSASASHEQRLVVVCYAKAASRLR